MGLAATTVGIAMQHVMRHLKEIGLHDAGETPLPGSTSICEHLVLEHQKPPCKNELIDNPSCPELVRWITRGFKVRLKVLVRLPTTCNCFCLLTLPA